MRGVIHLYLSFIFVQMLTINLIAGPFDTGMTTLEQPNEVTFTGRIWGDEFIYRSETVDGYCFVQSNDGWYYYATLDSVGEYSATTYKVGIDTPPPSSYQLERSQDRMDEILLRIKEFGEAVERSKDWYAQKQAEANGQGQPYVNLKIGIILIEFADSIKHYKTGLQGNRPYGYYTEDFENMMFSENYWYEPEPHPGSPSAHPENEAIFGSFKEYWLQMSKDQLRVGGQVVNPTDLNGVPEWLTADYSQSEYAYILPFYTLANEAISKATTNGWISPNPGNPNYYDKLVIIFAQNGIKLSNLHTYADPDLNYIMVSERSSEELWSNTDFTFTHVGVYAHEFGHNIGFHDEYLSTHSDNPEYSGILQEDGNTDTYNFDLMSWGIYNGPLRKGECPSTLSPYYRVSKNWISTIPVDENLDNFLVVYDYENPKVYRINPASAIEDEHFLFESRGRDGFDKYLPWSPNDTISQPGRLIVWYHNMQYYYPPTGFTTTDRSRIINADNTRHWFSQLTDFFPSTFNPGIQDYNDISLPPTTMGFQIEIGPGVFLGNYRPAHFALNGIEKLGNGSTIIEGIKIDHAIIKNNISGGWQLISVGAILSDFAATTVFPTAIGTIYKYVPGIGYVGVDTLENGPGYWAKFASQPETLIHAGNVIEYWEIPVSSGWNITGTISDKIPVPNVCTDPPNIIQTIYAYENGYVLMTNDSSLIPGKGYWIKTNNSGTVILDRYAEPCAIQKVTSTPEINLASLDKFIVTDSDGKQQSLYVANTEIDTALRNIIYTMPPPMPEAGFDARFNYGEFIKGVSVDSGLVDLEIDVESYAYPITLSWELNPENGIEYSFIGDSSLGKITQIEINKGQSKYSENSGGKIRLFGKVNDSFSSNQVPKRFTLEQNYPNPFNPVTTIKYSIPKDGLVTLTIYNALGERVTELVNKDQMAGNYVVQFDASGISSGVYFYKISVTGSGQGFTDVKKMVLVK